MTNQIAISDEYIITDIKIAAAYHLVGIELGNGTYALCYDDSTKVYANFRTYRKALCDVLARARKMDDFKIDFIRGMTRLSPEPRLATFALVSQNKDGDWDTNDIRFVEAEDWDTVNNQIDKIIDKENNNYYIVNVKDDRWQHFKVSGDSVKEVK